LLKSGQAYIAWRKFRKNKVSLIGGAIILATLLLAILAPVIAPYDPTKTNLREKELPPSTVHLLGTDTLGRDIASCVIWGARTSLIVGFGALIIELVIGILIGAVAGYYGGWIDEALMRVTDIILTLPTIVLLIVAASMFEVRSIYIIMVVMAIISWPWIARVTRGEFLSLKESLFVEAARSMGASDKRIIFRHILINALSPIIVLATTDVAWFILYESTLSFLGLGDVTSVSWGIIINRGKNVLRSSWWITTFPGLAIFITVLGFNLLGDGLSDAFDIKKRV